MGVRLTRSGLLRISLMYQLHGLRDAQIAGETFVLGVTLRVFLDEISI